MHGLLLDAAMNFAINSALPGRDRTRATLEMKVETMRPALVGETYRLRGEVVRMARQVAYAEATVIDDKDQTDQPVDGDVPPPSGRRRRRARRPNRRRLYPPHPERRRSCSIRGGPSDGTAGQTALPIR